ncbi:hypothetical protein BDV93DRAFT_605733 [Ceratobasidium sp. AG-I]|nr:hypothetical protein BDV93DRAFT_605733 [Ceratobasidium sp. AG-I]
MEHVDLETPSQVDLPQVEEREVDDDSVANSSDVEINAEPFHDFESYEKAALGATKFIYYGKFDPGKKDKKKKVNPKYGMWDYQSKAKQPKGITGKTVGVGIKKLEESNPIDLIRLDHDLSKGLHFNVFGWDESKQHRDDNKKFAAQFPYNPAIHTEGKSKWEIEREKEAQFFELVEKLQQLTGEKIWQEWENGRKPK